MKVPRCAIIALILLVNCELSSADINAANDQGSSSKLIRQEPAPAIAVTATPQCALIKCSDQGAGVCASDGKTYPNACQVTAASCNSPGLKVVSEGLCLASTPVVAPAPAPKKCTDMCPRIYQPVCDSKGITYSNSCEFSQAQCKNPALKKGKCPVSSSPPPAKKCELPQCAPIEKPICASNGKTYMNRCLFSYSACKDPTLTVMSDGECGSVVQDQDDNTPTGCMAMTCRQFSECRVDERTGLGYCADVCAPGRCAKNEKCVLNQVQCFTTPCPAIAECVSLSPTVSK